jgi:hypothetical protein
MFVWFLYMTKEHQDGCVGNRQDYACTVILLPTNGGIVLNIAELQG